jgi:hypothetical protein
MLDDPDTTGMVHRILLHAVLVARDATSLMADTSMCAA